MSGTFAVTCPECGAGGPLPQVHVGKRIRCKKCGARFIAHDTSASIQPQKARSEPEPGGVYQNGDNIPCESCGQQLKVKYFPPKGITIGGPDAMRGIALRCQRCEFITCIECAMKPMAGQVQACPSCKEVMGPTLLTQGVDELRRKQVTQPVKQTSSNEKHYEDIREFLQEVNRLGREGGYNYLFAKLKHIMVKCRSCKRVIAGDTAFVDNSVGCPHCRDVWAQH